MMIDEAPALDAAWRSAAAQALGVADAETLVRRTFDGIAIEPLYPPAAGETALGSERAAGSWQIAQRIDHPDHVEANRLALADLGGGAGALTLVASGAPSARGFGVRLGSVEETQTLFEDVDLGLIGLRLDPGPHGFDLAELVAEAAQQRGYGLAELDLDLGIDPVGVLATTGALAADWSTLARRTGEKLDSLRQRGFAGRALRPDGRPWSDAGASEAQELAAVVASGVLYLRALEAANPSLEAARDALSFTLTADADLLLTVAKFRAMRLLWARIEDACGLGARPIHLHAETAWRGLTALGPHTNLVRAALGAFAAMAGGADAMTVLPFTLPLGLPDGFARRLARNTQHILIDEAGLLRVTDPAGGAGAFEALTRDLCAKAWALFQDIEQEGGIVNSLVAGQVQRRIAAVRDARRAAIAEGRDRLVGATMFREEREVLPPVLMTAAPGVNGTPFGPLRAEPLVAERFAEPFEAGLAMVAPTGPGGGP